MPTIDLRRGDDLSLDVSFTDRTSGNPASMIGWGIAAEMQFGNCPEVELSAAWVSENNGTGRVTHPAANTESLSIGEYMLRVILTDPDGRKTSSASTIIRVTN